MAVARNTVSSGVGATVRGTKSSVVPFSFDGLSVRVVLRQREPWWVLADVCRVLEIGNPSDAARRLDDDERGVDTVETPSAPQQMVIINESGLYSLILTSRKPAAKRFKKWVTSEVLPSIRKTGAYRVSGASRQKQDDMRAANRLAYDWSQRDFRRYQAWLGNHLQKLREAGWTDSADAALAQLSVDPLLIGRPASQGPLIGDEPVGVGAIHLPDGWLVFDSNTIEGLRAGQQVLAVSPDGAVLTVILADCWAGPDRYAHVPQYGPRTGWMPVPSTAGPDVRAARAVLVLGRMLKSH
jgi:prophage antirepressor-like protein